MTSVLMEEFLAVESASTTPPWVTLVTKFQIDCQHIVDEKHRMNCKCRPGVIVVNVVSVVIVIVIVIITLSTTAL